jgi:hypothetical protein
MKNRPYDAKNDQEVHVPVHAKGVTPSCEEMSKKIMVVTGFMYLLLFGVLLLIGWISAHKPGNLVPKYIRHTIDKPSASQTLGKTVK